MSDPPAVRVGDREREAVADTLRRHAALGRLDPEELDERLGHAWSARTQPELDALTRDLPALPAEDEAPARRPVAVPVSVRPAVVSWLTVNLIVLAIWLASGDGIHDFWPKWVLLVSTVGLIARLARRWAGDDEGQR